jgi:pimeloyl-ACP methyl ester carboxylesterase
VKIRTLASVIAFALATTGTIANAQSVANPIDVSDSALVKTLPGFSEHFVTVNGVKLHYVEGGKGPALLLLPVWPETWWEYHKVMPELAKNHRVIAVDIRGMSASGKPGTGYDKKTMGADVAELVKALGLGKVDVMGHDIGSMVAYSFAAQYPDTVRRLVLLDLPPPDASLAKWALLPGVGPLDDKVGDGSHAYAWWFAFHQVPDLNVKMAAGRGIRAEEDWIFHYLTRDDASIDSRDRAVYEAAYLSPEAIRAGDGWYQAFPQDMVDDDSYPKLKMPVLGLAGPSYAWLAGVMPAKATNLKLVRLADSGHFIAEEQPEELLSNLNTFLK